MMKSETKTKIEDVVTIVLILIAIAGAALAGHINREVKRLNSYQEVEESLLAEETTEEIPDVILDMQSRQQIKYCVDEVSNIEAPIEIAADTLEYELGITPDMYDTFYGVRSSIENSVDSIIVVKSKKEYTHEVENLMNDYITRITDESSLRDEAKLKNSSIEVYKEYAVISVNNKENTDLIIKNIEELPEI